MCSVFEPDRPLEFAFLDDRIDLMYRTELRLGQILNAFSLLAVFVACLGLFGLASFTAQKRTKEIGIRKVLGAPVHTLILLLSGESARLVLISNLMAWPLAYWTMNRWLNDFAYRIDLEPEVFLWGGLLGLVIALLAVSYQAVQAATANPVEALRYE